MRSKEESRAKMIVKKDSEELQVRQKDTIVVRLKLAKNLMVRRDH